MPARQNLRDSRAAGALVALMVVLPVVLIALAAYSHRGFAEMQATSAESLRARALYIAQAGVQKAAHELLEDPEYREERSEVPFGGGRFGYTIEGDEVLAGLGERFHVSATATYGEEGQDPVGIGLSVVLAPTSLSVIDHAVASLGPISIGEDASIGDPFRAPNDVYSAHDGPGGVDRALEGDDDPPVYGDARLVTLTTQSSPPRVVPGPIDYGVEALPFPSFDLAALEAKARANTSNPRYPGGAYFSGRTTFRDETLRGVIYVDGEVVLRGTVTVDEGCIIGTSADPFTVQADLTVRTDDRPGVGTPHLAILKVGGGTLKFDRGQRLDLEGFVFADSHVRLLSDGELRGGVVVDSTDGVEIMGRCIVVHRAIDLEDLAAEVSVTALEGMEIESWREDPDLQVGGVPQGRYPGSGPSPGDGGSPAGGVR